MKSWVEGYRGLPVKIRRQILRRDPLCYLCQNAASVEVDHKIPRSRGGTDDPENLGGACQPCHSAKTKAESLSGRQKAAASRRLPPEPHPGTMV